MDADEFIARAERVDAARAQAHKDAVRYQWLRKQHEGEGPSWHVREPNNEIPDALDAAIDAAMAECRE